MNKSMNGIYAASITPLDDEGQLAMDALAAHLNYLESNGCGGAVILGTTGEGPSFSVDERTTVLKTAAQNQGNLKLMAGTGATSLTDAVTLTHTAFDLGYDAVLIVPPFYFRNAGVDGLFTFYEQVINQAVPGEGKVLLYHIPQVSGVAIEVTLIHRLRDAFPEQIAGIKDSSGIREHTLMLCHDFDDFMTFTGNDKLLDATLDANGAGGISALANVFPQLPAAVFDAHCNNRPTDDAQAHLTTIREKIEDSKLTGAVLAKALLHIQDMLPSNNVRPPLRRVSSEDEIQLKSSFKL